MKKLIFLLTTIFISFGLHGQTAKFIAVEGATLLQDDTTVVCTITPTGTPSNTCKVEGNGMLKDGYTVSVSNITVPSAGATIPDPGPYVVAFESTATTVKADGTLVLLENDKTVIINAIPQMPGSPNVPYPVAFKIEITAAGQIKINAL